MQKDKQRSTKHTYKTKDRVTFYLTFSFKHYHLKSLKSVSFLGEGLSFRNPYLIQRYTPVIANYFVRELHLTLATSLPVGLVGGRGKKKEHNLRKKEKIRHLRYVYFVTVNQVVMATVECLLR